MKNESKMIQEYQKEIENLNRKIADFQEKSKIDVLSFKAENEIGKYFQTTIQSIGDAVITTDINGKITIMNTVAERLTGWNFEHANGKPLKEIFKIINEQTRKPVDGPVALILKEGKSVNMANHTLLLNKDGLEIPIADSGAPIRDENENIKGVVLVFRDQSDERYQSKLQSVRLQLLDFYFNNSLEDILTKTLDEVEILTGSKIGFYHFVDDDQETLTLQAWSTATKKYFCKAEGQGLHYKMSEAGVWVDCVKERKPIIHNDYKNLPNKRGMPEGHAEVNRELVVPIFRQHKVVAILGVGNKPTDYNQKDINTVSFIADIAWEIALKKRNEEALDAKTRALAERVKEMSCLLKIKELILNQDITLDEMLMSAVNLLPPAFQFPEICFARIIFDSYEFVTPNYKTTNWILSRELKIQNTIRGKIEVGYLVERAKSDEGPFLLEERNLLNSFTQNITQHIERKEIKEAQIKSEEKLRITLNSIGDAVIATDNGGFITRMNPVAERLTGYSIEEAEGKHIDHIFNIFNTQTGARTINPVSRVLKEGKVVGLANHTKLISKTGAEFQIADSAAPIKDLVGEIKGVVLVFRDVTKEYQMQEDLINSQKLLLQAQKIGKIGSWTLNLDTNKFSGSAMAWEIYGLDKQTEASATIVQSIPLPEYRLMLDEALTKLITGQEKYDLEFKIKRQSDEKIIDIQSVAEFDSKENTVFGTIQDISKRKETEKILFESELRFRAFVENANDIIFSTNYQGEFVYVSPNWTKFMNEPSEKPIGKTYLEYIHPDDVNECVNYFGNLNNSVDLPSGVEYRVKTADGIWRWHLTKASVQKNQEGQSIGFIGIARDVTQSHDAADALGQSEMNLRSILDNSADAIIISNQSGNINYVNKKAIQLLGYNSAELLQMNILDLANEDHISEHQRLFANLINQGHSVLEIELTRKDKTQVPIELNAIILPNGNVFGNVRDITERKNADSVIKESQTRLTNIMDNLPGVAYRCKLDRNWTMEFLSKECLSLTGYESSDLIDNKVVSYEQIIHPDDRKRIRKNIISNIQDNKVFQIEYRIITKENEVKWVWEKGLSTRKNNQGVHVLEGLIIDITAKKEAEFDLKNALNRNNAILKAIPDLMFLFNNEYRIIDFNSKNKNDLYTSPNFFLGKKIQEVMPIDIAEMTMKSVDKVLKTGELMVSKYHLDLKEGRQYFEVRHVKSGEKEVLAIVRNTSEQVQMEATLKSSEEKFRNLFNKHSAVKLILEPLTGKITEANEAAAKFYGWTVAQLVNMNIRQIIVFDKSSAKKGFSKPGNNEKSHFDIQHRLADGSLRDVEVFNSKIIIDHKEFLHSIIHDVTEKKKAEEKLSLLSRSVEQTPVSIVITNAKGIIEYVNPAFCNITGYTFAEALGQNPRILKSGNKTEAFYKELWQTILSGKDWKGEFQNKKKNGEIYWEDVIISPIANKEGEITHFVAVKENISKKKKLIAELIEAKEKAEESDRLKSAFLANMSHEIRTPMNGILGFAGLLKMPDLSIEEKDQFIEIIQKSGERMLTTVNDLIDISKIETDQMPIVITNVDFNNMLDSLFQFFKPEAAAKNLRLNLFNNLPTPFIIKSDEAKLDSILINLVKNAIKYTDRGSIDIHCEIENNELKISVKDTGIGIPSNRQVAVFNRFEQSDVTDTRAFQGSGLGLAITKAYVEMLGGTILLESEPGFGSVFSVFLPFSTSLEMDKSAENDALNTYPEFAKEVKKIKILIADDDETAFYYLNTILKDFDAEILQANDGIEAVEKFKANQDLSLILMDMKMPLMDGYEATRQIRMIDKNIPIIAQTAFALTGDKEKATNCGCTDYLSKPISHVDLLEMMEKYLRKS